MIAISYPEIYNQTLNDIITNYNTVFDRRTKTSWQKVERQLHDINGLNLTTLVRSRYIGLCQYSRFSRI